MPGDYGEVSTQIGSWDVMNAKPPKLGGYRPESCFDTPSDNILNIQPVLSQRRQSNSPNPISPSGKFFEQTKNRRGNQIEREITDFPDGQWNIMNFDTNQTPRSENQIFPPVYDFKEAPESGYTIDPQLGSFVHAQQDQSPHLIPPTLANSSNLRTKPATLSHPNGYQRPRTQTSTTKAQNDPPDDQAKAQSASLVAKVKADSLGRDTGASATTNSEVDPSPTPLQGVGLEEPFSQVRPESDLTLKAAK